MRHVLLVETKTYQTWPKANKSTDLLLPIVEEIIINYIYRMQLPQKFQASELSPSV